MKWVMVLVLLLPIVAASTIHGTVYDLELNEVESAIVEINTSPNQKLVAKDGTFLFDVPPGQYLLSAKSSEGQVEEEIRAKDNGTFVIDLILFPTVDETLLEELPDIPEVESIIEDKPASQWLIWLGVFAMLGAVLYFSMKPKRKEAEKKTQKQHSTDDLLAFVEKEGGRTTQKEIRKHFPFSEAKISLMIDELEEQGKVKRIKKGRGNIIVRQ